VIAMPEADVQLRRATEADLHELIELELSEMPTRPDAAALAAQRQCDRLARQDRGEIELLVAEIKGMLVGQTVLRWQGRSHQPDRPDRRRTAEIEDLRVLEGFRDLNLGERMIEHVEWMCAREGVDRLAMPIDPVRQSPLAAWLEGLGYARFGEPYRIERTTFGPEGDEPGTRVDLIKEI
jgi:GNAT superfamily N-acetyltransferase